MIWIAALAAWIVLGDAVQKIDQHPIPPSAYVDLGVGGALLIFCLVGLLLGREDD